MERCVQLPSDDSILYNLAWESKIAVKASQVHGEITNLTNQTFRIEIKQILLFLY